MSGGSYNYAYQKVREFEGLLRERLKDSPRRLLFADLLVLVSVAMHDIEWVDSCDYGPNNENKEIDAVFAFLEKGMSETRLKAVMLDRIAELVRKSEL